MLAHLYPRHVGRYRIELATKLRRRIRLEIERVDGALTPLEEDEDERDVLGTGGFQAIGREQVRKAKAHSEQARGAHTQEVSARLAVAERSRHRSVSYFFRNTNRNPVHVASI